MENPITNSEEYLDSSHHSQQELVEEEERVQEQLPISGNDGQRVYLVPLRWWKEAQGSLSSDEKKGIPYAATSTAMYGGPMKLINNFFNSDLSFNLRKEVDSSTETSENAEVGISGRDYALVSGEMWLQALKWHSDSKLANKDGKSSPPPEEDMSDVYPVQLRLSIMRETESFVVKISKKENMLECFRRACKIFCIETEPLRIWDFSGETVLYFMNDKHKMLKDSQRQPEQQDILLELQVYGLSDPSKSRGIKKEDVAVQQSNGGSLKMNGCVDNGMSNNLHSNSSVTTGCCEVGTLGLTGLQNLGNTCFMNSSLQCLAHTPKIVDFFLGDYRKEINHDNPLGMNGEIASAFGDLLKKLWAPGALPLSPRIFKSKLAHFAPQFNGFNQHDSQEFLAFLLDGLHEDLNRVKCKPYNEVKDEDSRPDEEVANEYWRNHLARNDSIIVDVCQGQYRSTLVCPVCRKVSITFDPFMYLSLPLPSTSMRTMTITVVKIDDTSNPSPFTINVPKTGKLNDLIQALSTACSLGVDESLLVAEVFNNRIIWFLEESANSLSLIRDADQLVAYRMTKEIDEGAVIVFTHQQMEEHYINGKLTVWKAFGIPLVAYSSVVNESDIRSLYLKLLFQFLRSKGTTVNHVHETINTGSQDVKVEDANGSESDGCTEDTDAKEAEAYFNCEFEFYLADEKGNAIGSQLTMDKPLNSMALPGRLNVLVRWPDKMVEQFDKYLICSLPEVFKSGYLIKRPQESISLYKCLEAFLKEEPLGPEDMWYCPVCKKHCQASKKLDLWRLPEVLVIHLKRFSYSRFSKNKLETSVDFPIQDLDLSSYIAYKNGRSSNLYRLHAISNHYGSMGGGHYTAFVHHGAGQWYDFDDIHVSPISEDKIKSSAAYVLFYRRVEEEEK